MIDLVDAFLAAVVVFFRSRLDTSLEVFALRQQLAVLKRKQRRPVLSRLDRLFWIMLRSVAAMVGCPGSRQTSDGNRVASKRLSTLLALAIQAAGWST